MPEQLNQLFGIFIDWVWSADQPTDPSRHFKELPSSEEQEENEEEEEDAVMEKEMRADLADLSIF